MATEKTKVEEIEMNENLSCPAEQAWILCSKQLKPVISFGMVKTSERTTPSELMMKQSCLSLATSIPTQIIVKPPTVYLMLYPQGALLL